MVRLLKANRWLRNELREACDLDNRFGRRRERGDWELVAVAFVASGYVDIQPWHDDAGEEIWRACGFASKPSYRTTWRRLRELEGVADAFLMSVGKLVRRAVPSRNSAIPRCTVSSLIPVARDTAMIPPRPCDRASDAAQSRR